MNDKFYNKKGISKNFALWSVYEVNVKIFSLSSNKNESIVPPSKFSLFILILT